MSVQVLWKACAKMKLEVGRDLLGRMPLKDEGEREQDQMGKPSDHGRCLIAIKKGDKGRWRGRACSPAFRKSQPG